MTLPSFENTQSSILKDMTMKLTKIATMGTLALSIAGLSACNNMTPSSSEDVSTQTPTSSQAVSDMNVVQIAQSNADFSLLVEAVEAAGFAAPLSNPNANFTIFAPTNEAFAQVLQETGMTKDQLFANKPLLTKILGYHVINGAAPVYAEDIQPGAIAMLSKDTLMVTDQGQLKDENGRTTNIVKTDIAANNGVVHVIDKVLLPK